MIKAVDKIRQTYSGLFTLSGDRKSLFKNFSIYFVGILALKATYIILLPIYTRELTSSEYGQLELVLIFIGIYSLILSMGLPQYLALIYFHHEGMERSRNIAQVFFTFIYLATPVAIISILLVNPIKLYFFDSGLSDYLLYLAIIISYFTFFSNAIISLLRVKQRAKQVVSLQVGTGVLIMTLNIAFILLFNLGVMGIVIAQLLSVLLICMVGYHLFTTSGISRWRKVHISKMIDSIKIGAPLVASTFFVMIMVGADRWFLAYYSTAADIGIYSLAYRLASLFEVVVLVAFSSAYSPYIYSLFQKEGVFSTEKINSRVMRYYTLLVCPLSLIVLYYSEPIFLFIIGKEFHSAYMYIYPVLVSYLFLGVMNMSGMCLMFEKKTNYIFFSFFLGAASNIIMNYYAIPRYNILGASITTMLSYFLVMISLLYFRRKVIQSSYRGHVAAHA